jgi:hypothetical protein
MKTLHHPKRRLSDRLKPLNSSQKEIKRMTFRETGLGDFYGRVYHGK